MPIFRVFLLKGGGPECDYLLLDGIVQCDECSNARANENSLVATIHGGVDARHVFEIDPAAKGDILTKYDEYQQCLHDVEDKWIKCVVEARTMRTTCSGLTAQIDEVRRE